MKSRPAVKSSTSVLSLPSDDEIDVSAQYRAVTPLLPRQMILLPVVISPDGELERPALLPNPVLLMPVVALYKLL